MWHAAIVLDWQCSRRRMRSERWGVEVLEGSLTLSSEVTGKRENKYQMANCFLYKDTNHCGCMTGWRWPRPLIRSGTFSLHVEKTTASFGLQLKLKRCIAKGNSSQVQRSSANVHKSKKEWHLKSVSMRHYGLFYCSSSRPHSSLMHVSPVTLNFPISHLLFSSPVQKTDIHAANLNQNSNRSDLDCVYFISH